MTVKEWLRKTYDPDEFVLIRNRAVCADGFTISIQASRGHYCTPRGDKADGEYTTLELGYPSKREETLEKYREDTIYPWVPIEAVEQVIENHGGIVWND